jgi:hypothetical protein
MLVGPNGKSAGPFGKIGEIVQYGFAKRGRGWETWHKLEHGRKVGGLTAWVAHASCTAKAWHGRGERYGWDLKDLEQALGSKIKVWRKTGQVLLLASNAQTR